MQSLLRIKLNNNEPWQTTRLITVAMLTGHIARETKCNIAITNTLRNHLCNRTMMKA